MTSYHDLRGRVVGMLTGAERPPVVAISGHGGAGKSTLAARLMTDLGGTSEQVVRTDCFYAAGAGPGSGLFDLHDWAVLLDLLGRLRATPPARRLTYPVRAYDGAQRTCDVPMPPVVVVEGIRLLRPETLGLMDLAVWIDLSPEVAGRRAVARNRQQGDSSDELDLWRTKWVPEGHDYARLVRPETLADVVVAADGTTPSRSRRASCEGGAVDERVLANFLAADGSLRTIPSKRAKLLVVLDHLAQSFDLGRTYPEQEVNEVLKRFHPDCAALRRYLVEDGFLTREDGSYWRSGGSVDA
ncbi:DUF2087 domain-containing protein [Nocardioides sp.]|uniref:DUF2087 domain-containing protein n=1 Tax=Nocardioides sp. TaxID=35761 RepID=UPI00286C5D27|nr:DUF2087 domain-containing protein [Nocardioides sp.]